MNIVVLAGGLCPERDVSLSSGSLIANALMRKNHKVILLDLYFGVDGASNFAEAYERYRTEEYHYIVPTEEPDLARIKAGNGNSDLLIGPNILSVCKTADITFLALHGSIGENGQLQAVFDVHNIRYTGTGYIGSLLAMNKQLSKEIMSYHSILTPDWIICNADSIKAPFLPCVIKPVSCGSSIGVSIAEAENEFLAAMQYAQKYEDVFLIEKKIEGREFSVGILGEKALPVIEIIPGEGFYDYRNKYQQGMTKEVCPAELGGKTAQKLQEIAQKVHSVLHLGSYSRVDFIIDGESEIYCLEANTLPGMTPTSLLPQEALALGIAYDDLCDIVIELENKSVFKFNYRM